MNSREFSEYRQMTKALDKLLNKLEVRTGQVEELMKALELIRHRAEIGVPVDEIYMLADNALAPYEESTGSADVDQGLHSDDR